VGPVAVGRVALAAAAAALALGATACGERSEPTGAAVRLYPVRVQDARDRPVTLDHRPLRIAALAPAAEQILDAIGARKRVVDPRRGFFDDKGNLLLDRLRRAKPDLIVVPVTDQRDEEPLSSLGTAVYFTPGTSIREVERAITQLGLLAGDPVAARKLVHAIESTRRRVVARVAGRPRTSVFVDTGFFTTVPDTSLVGDVIHEAGGVNIAGPTPEPGPFDLRKLKQLNPAVYLATSDSGTTLEQLRKDPRTRTLRAVRNGRFAVLDTNLLQPGPQVAHALLELAHVLHPDAFR
jgi:ABC-type Fe3+-hydroxamate transport system substrate-binding protein